jgi:hypothetical protein
VKKRWQNQYRQVNRLVSSIGVVIEKSPPNLVRAVQLKENFPNCKFIVFNRNPYAICSSSFHRLFQNMARNRYEIMVNLAKIWVLRSELLVTNIRNLDCPYFTYEYFCSNTTACIDVVNALCPELEDININVEFKVKDYPVQGLVNQNARQIQKLGKDDIVAINEVLQKNQALVEFFGYEFIS